MSREVDEHRQNFHHLRPRPGYAKPRWLWKTIHKVHGGTFEARQNWFGNPINACRGELPYILDHPMISLEGHLVFEPYCDLETAEPIAAAYAQSHNLQFTISPVGWWHPSTIRVEFYPK